MAFVDNTTGGRVILQGIMPVKITVTGACNVGDLIGYDNITSSLWELADAADKVPAQLIAGETNRETTATEITCFKMALIDFGSGSTATPGVQIYTSDTAGGYAATPSTWVQQCVGQCISATEAFIQPQSSPLCAYSTTGTGYSFIRTELAAGAESGVNFGGLRVGCKIINTATVGNPSGVNTLWLVQQFQDTDMSGYGTVLRLEDTSDAGCGGEAFISMHGGGGDSPDFTFLLYPRAATSGCWDGNGTSPSSSTSGFIKLQVGTDTKYIKLWDS